MLINLSELFTCEGKKKVYQADFTVPSIKLNGEVYQILSTEPFDLTVVNTGHRKFSIDGRVTVEIEIPCDRCLEPVSHAWSLQLGRELELKRLEDAGEEDLDEQPYLNGYNLDVDRLIYNELLLNWPMKVLCKEDCKGICNRCGTNLNQETCTCDKESLDPRMSVIQDIFRESKEV